MKDLARVEVLQPLTYLVQIPPQNLFWEGLVQFGSLTNEPQKIAVGCIFHHDAQLVVCTTGTSRVNRPEY